MSGEFVRVKVQLTGGIAESVRLPPGYEIRRTTAGWFSCHPDGWRSPHVALGPNASEDRAHLWQAVNHAFNRYIMSPTPPVDDRPPAAVGEIVPADQWPPDALQYDRLLGQSGQQRSTEDSDDD